MPGFCQSNTAFVLTSNSSKSSLETFLNIDVIINQSNFTPGETLDVETITTNDSTPDTVIKMLWVELPSGYKWSHSRLCLLNLFVNLC